MVTYGTDVVFKIIDIATPGARNIDEVWLAEDATINTSNANRGATVVVDFSYGISSIIEYTLDGGTTWIPFNNGVAVLGGQSRYIRVEKGDQVNFRAKLAGALDRCILGEP